MLFGYVHRRVGSTPAGVAAAAALLFLLPAVLVSEPPDPPGKAPWWNGLGSEFGAAPAILAAITAGILLLAAVFHGGGRPFAFVVRRKRPLTAGLLVVVVGFTAYEILNDRSVTEPPCHPAAGVPAAPAASVVGDSDRVHVYLDPRATPDQRNLVVAAMRRSNALAEEAELIWQPGSAEFKKQYCGGGRVASDAVAGLPYFFSARLDYAPDFPAFLDEVGNQAAVLSVQRVPA
jgi:hypothetical protein